jgi:hypothetical protein
MFLEEVDVKERAFEVCIGLDTGVGILHDVVHADIADCSIFGS